MDVLKRIEKIIRENAFEQNKKKPGLKFNPGLALIGLRTTGPTDVYAQQFYTAVYIDYNQERILSSLVTISVTTKFYLSKSHYQDLKCDCKLALRSFTQYDPWLFTDEIPY